MKTLLLSLCLLISTGAFAQVNLAEMEIHPSNNDLTRTIQTTCSEQGDAKIVFFSKIRGLRFESTSGINEIDSLPAENKYMLCVDPNVTHIITIDHPNYVEKKYYVGKLETQQVIQYIINSVEPFSSQPRDTLYNGEFYLASNPPGATIYMDGIPSFKERTPFTFKKYEARVYNLQLELENYKTEKIQIAMSSVKPGSKTVTLTPKTGYLTVSAENGAANGAAIFLDGNRIGNVPLQDYQVNQSRYNLVVEKKGFSTLSQQIEILENKKVSIPVKMFTTKQVVITSNIPRARIYIDRKYVGKTKLEYDLGIGKHNIVVEKENYTSDSAEVEITETSPDIQQVDLTDMRERLYKVSVKTRPSDAVVYLDGHQYGRTPATVESTIGLHTFKLKMPGYFTRSILKTVSSHGTTTINKSMFPKTLINLNVVYGLKSWGGEIGVMGSNLSLAVDWFPKMKQGYYEEQPGVIGSISDYYSSIDERVTKVSAKDTFGSGLAFKAGISFGRPIPTRIHIGYAQRAIYYNKTYRATADFEYSDLNGNTINAQYGDILRGTDIYKEDIIYYIVGVQICLFRYFNISADYWYNEKQSDIVFGAGFNIFNYK